MQRCIELTDQLVRAFRPLNAVIEELVSYIVPQKDAAACGNVCSCRRVICGSGRMVLVCITRIGGRCRGTCVIGSC